MISFQIIYLFSSQHEIQTTASKDRQTDRQIDRHTDRHICIIMINLLSCINFNQE